MGKIVLCALWCMFLLVFPWYFLKNAAVNGAFNLGVTIHETASDACLQLRRLLATTFLFAG